jgi:hypothetical protein
MTGDDSTLPPRDATIQLLDPAYQRPVRTWKFSEQTSITIGRADNVDVEIADAYVSRVHAEFTYRDGQWILISRGRNGVIVGSQTITELPISGDVTFRLGSAGPSLRFSTTTPAEAASATLSYTPETNPLLFLDETKVSAEVAQITSDDYFLKLQQKAKELRRNRNSPVGDKPA